MLNLEKSSEILIIIKVQEISWTKTKATFLTTTFNPIEYTAAWKNNELKTIHVGNKNIHLRTWNLIMFFVRRNKLVEV